MDRISRLSPLTLAFSVAGLLSAATLVLVSVLVPDVAPPTPQPFDLPPETTSALAVHGWDPDVWTPAVLAALPHAQASILSDGHVSSDELDSAGAAVVSCLEARGFWAEMNFSPRGSTITVRDVAWPTPAPPSSREEDRMTREVDACSDTYIRFVQFAWEDQGHRPRP